MSNTDTCTMGWNCQSHNPRKYTVLNETSVCHIRNIFRWGGGEQSAHMTDTNTLVLQSCTVALRAEHGLSSEISVQSSDDSNEVITIKIVGEVVRIKEEDEPIAISFSTIKNEPEVSPQTFHQYLVLPSVLMPLCLSVCLST
jgi:hypothetical protein